MTNIANPERVAIVGTAPTSKMLAPFDDKSWAIWACSAGNVDQLPRVNIWFELHALIEMTGVEMKGMALPFFKWLREKSEDGSFDVVMLEAGSAVGGTLNTFVPKAIPYPRDEMIALFGRNWFSSSIAYMLALAIARGAKEIGLFGVDMAADQEHYEAQRAGCIRFIEIAIERGIKIHVPPESSLNAAPRLYGYWEGTAFGRRVTSLTNAVRAAQGQAATMEQSARDQKNYYAVSLEQLRYFERTWTDGTDMEADLGAFATAYLKKAAEITAPAPADGLGIVDHLGNRLEPVAADPPTIFNSTAASLHKLDWHAVDPARPNGHMVASTEPLPYEGSAADKLDAITGG